MKILETIGATLILVIGIIGFVFLIALFLSLPFMLMWNYAVVSAISVANVINFWQAFWLLFFIGFFIKSTDTKK